MSERYFPGFVYKEPRPEPPMLVGEQVLFSYGEAKDRQGAFDRVEHHDDPWTQLGVVRAFNRTLRVLNSRIITPPLTLERKSLVFVRPEVLRPQTEDERRRLIESYGEYIIDKIGGDCQKLRNGSFLMRIGAKEQEERIEKESVLQIMSHEYGHTIGEDIGESVFEELKAYAFSNLFMRTYHGFSDYDVAAVNNGETHNIALNWLEQLKVAGVSEEDILAHLTGMQFGPAHPLDYRKRIII